MVLGDSESDEEERIVYNGELVLEEVLNFHQVVNKKPTAWKLLIERIDVNGMKVKCKICGDSFRNSDTFMTHALRHTGEKTYKCRMPDCSRQYTTFSGLKVHLMIHVGGPTYKCDTCDATFNNLSSIYRHTRTHSVVSTFTELGREENVFDDEDPYLEELIQFHRFQKVESETTNELTEIIKDGAERYKCTECGVRSSHMKQHISHVVKHTGEKPFKCRVLDCTGGLASWDDLKEHLKTAHYKGKKYICEVCGKKFDLRTLLNKHVLDHHKNMDKVYACSYCDSTFPKRFKVVNHEKLHNPGNDRLLKCEYCDKQFLNGNGRKFHKIKEHGVRVLAGKDNANEFFTCVKCFSSFKDEGSFKDHKETCSFVVNENFKCRFCSQKFQEQYAYQDHEENFHNDKLKALLANEMKEICEDIANETLDVEKS